MRGSGRDTAFHYSLAEFAYILFFLCFAVLSYTGFLYLREKGETARLSAEVIRLTEVIARLENGNVPCFKKEDSPIPEFIAVITIKSRTRLTITCADGRVEAVGAPPEALPGIMEKKVAQLFARETAYRDQYGCYLRVQIVNETNDYGLYRNMADIMRSLGIIVPHV